MKLPKAVNWLKRILSPANNAGDSFCVLPFRHIYILPNETVKPCCVFEGIIQDGGRPMSMREDSTEKIWNSEQMQDIRQRMVRGAPVEACRYCTIQESKGVVSTRQAMTEGWAKGWLNPEMLTAEDVKEAAIANAYRTEPETLEIVLGSTCNLKCRMCYADSSSAIAADPIHSHWVPLKSSPFVRTAEGHSWLNRKEHILAGLLHNPKQFKGVGIVGGETLILKETNEIMQHLIDSGAAENLTLTVYTNATVVSEKWCDLAVQFKTVAISVSLDGFQTVNDYIRYPSRWDELEIGLRRLQELPNALLAVNVTVQAYNILDIVAIARFCEEQAIPMHPHILKDPSHLSSFIMPLAIRQEAAHRLKAYATNSRVHWRADMLNLADAWEAAPECNPSLLREFMIFTNDLDLSRGQDFADSLPELRAYLERCGFPWIRDTRFTAVTQNEMEGPCSS